MKSTISPLTENIMYCHHNELLNDELGRSIMQIYRAGVCDDKIVKMIEKRVSKHKFEQAFYGTVPFKTAKLTNGDYTLGLDQNNNNLLSSIQYLNAHSLTVAGSGAGKTTYSYFKILQVAPNIDGLWLFDMRKTEFRILRSYLQRVGVELIIIPARSLRINPLQLPVGVTLSDWIPRICDTLVESLDLPPRASKLLQVRLFGLYSKFDGSKKQYPTLFDLFETIKNDKCSNHQARSAILDNLEPVLLSLGPEVLAYRHGWSSDDLAKHHVVFELAGCSEIDKNLILNTLVLSEFTSRVARGISNPLMNLLMFIDEAQRLCSSSSAIADLIGLIRGTGIGLDLSLQNASSLIPQVVSNTATKVLGRCGSFTDYSSAGSSMGLNSEMIQWAQSNLRPGTFVGQLGEGQWRCPFIFKIPKMSFSSTNNPAVCADNPLPNLPTVYANEFCDWSKSSQVQSSEKQTNKSQLFNSKQEYLFCKAVVDSPMKISSEYPKLAGISPNKSKDIRNNLIVMQYIREHTLGTGARGRSSILLEALPDGIQAVNQYGDQS